MNHCPQISRLCPQNEARNVFGLVESQMCFYVTFVLSTASNNLNIKCFGVNFHYWQSVDSICKATGRSLYHCQATVQALLQL